MGVEGHKIEGIRVPAAFNQEYVREAFRYRPRDGDIVLVTYPKSGTTWTQCIISFLLHYETFVADIQNLNRVFPFIELHGTAGLRSGDEVNCVKTHLPFREANFNPRAKYIYVIRNPRDVVVSFFFHLRYLHGENFDDFLSNFCSSSAWFGEYFDSVRSWLEGPRAAAEKTGGTADNVLVVIYEKMKADRRGELLRIANFLGGKAAERVKDEKVLEDILEKTSVQKMRETMNPSYMKEAMRRHPDLPPETDLQFVRKGQVGDWKNYFTPPIEEMFTRWINSKPENLKIMQLFD